MVISPIDRDSAAEKYPSDVCNFDYLTSHREIFVDGICVGCIGWIECSDDDFVRIISLSILIQDEFRGNGFCRDAVEMLIDEYIEDGEQIYINSDLKNKRSMSVFKKIGFTLAVGKTYFWQNRGENQQKFTVDFVNHMRRSQKWHQHY